MMRPGNLRRSPTDLLNHLRLERVARRHLHVLGTRGLVEAIVTIADELDAWEFILATLEDHARPDFETLALVGGDRFPPRPKHRLPRALRDGGQP